MQNYREKRSKLKLGCLTVMVMMLGVVTNLRADWTSNLPKSYAVSAGFGSPVIISEISYINTGPTSLDFTLGTTDVITTPDTGYEFAPSLTWLTAAPSTFSLAANSTKDATQLASITIQVPFDVTYLGKKYELYYKAKATATGDSVGTFVTTKFLITMDSQAILLSFADETPITSINMVGNKLIIKSKIISLASNKVTLNYRKKLTTTYTVISAKSTAAVAGETSATVYTFEIPASAIDVPGLEYFIKSDAGASIVYYPSADTANAATFDGIPYTIDVTKTTTGTIAANTISTISVPDGNSEDGTMQLASVKGAVGSNLNVTITQKDYAATHAAPPMSLSDKPAVVFDFGPSGTRFAKAVTLTMVYFDLNNDGIIDNITDAAGFLTITPDMLRLFYWDGFNWRLTAKPSSINTTNHTVTCSIDHFSEYALFPVASLSPTDYRPKMKIITPNGDGYNDEADFNSLSEEIKIFDITG